MKRIFGSAACLMLMAVAANCVAAEKFDAAAAAKAVAPFVEQETALVVRVDLRRMSLGPIVDLAARIVPDAKDEMASDVAEASKVLDAVRRAGADEAFVVVTPSGTGPIPQAVAVFPLRPTVDEKVLRVALREAAASARRVGDALLVPPNPRVELPAEFHPVDRPELAQALAAVGEAAFQAVLIPPASARRVVEELLPPLPKQVGGGPGTILTHGITWATVGIDLSPQPAVRLVIQSQDQAAAVALRAKCVEAIKLATGQEEIQALLPQSEKLTAMLTPRIEGDRLLLTLDDSQGQLSQVLRLVGVPLQRARFEAQRAWSMNNLKMFGLAMHNYHDQHKHFPAPASYNPDGKPLLSWRVQILPYLDEEKLYKQFHLDEPWDSEHNKALIDQMPPIFRSPMSKAGKGYANYVVPVGDGALYASMKDEPRMKDIKDGTSNTIMVLEVDDAHAVVWTKPDDLPFDPAAPKSGVGGLYPDRFPVTFCDGSAHRLPKDVAPATLKALFTRSGGEPIPWNDIR